MNQYWPYLFKVSIGFSMLYTLYWLLFRNKTFHLTNRIILLLIVFSSLLIPLMELPVTDSTIINYNYQFEWANFDHYIDDFTVNTVQINRYPNSLFDWFTILYLTGVAFLGIRFILYLIRILSLRYKSNHLKLNRITLVYTQNQLPPFTFFKWVFLPEEEFKQVYSHPIIEHESAHARQWHSFDLLLAELFSIFLWFVPFVYSFKNSMESVHEFLADNYTINKVSDKTEYLNLLATNTEKYTLIGLSNHFYCKTLKNRITMITKNKSPKWSKIQYFILIPAIGLLVLACSKFDKPELLNTGMDITNEKVEITVAPAFIQPIEASECKITSPFGMRIHPIKKVEMMHNGIDYKAEKGTPVLAACDGTIIKKDFMKDTYGNVIVIQHANGLASVYAQLSEFKTELGHQIKQGEIIGLVGSSGLSTGSHLHFEIRKDGKYVNPADYIK